MTAATFSQLGIDPSVDAEFARIVDELTRRGFLAGGLSAAALVGLAACGGSHSSSGGSAEPEWSFTDDLAKTVRLPHRPRRIVSLGGVLTNTLYTAGLTVVGAPILATTNEQLRGLGMVPAQISAITKVNTGTIPQIDLEAVAKARPDLLVDVVSNGTAPNLIQLPGLAKLAPVVAINLQTAPLDQAMSTVHRLVTSLDIALADTRTQARYDQVAAALRTAVAAKPGLRVAFCCTIANEGLGVNVEPQWGYMKTLAGLGMQFTPAKASGDAILQTISWENAPGIDADLIVLWSGGVPTSPTWPRMPAVQAGQYLDMSNQWFTTAYSSYADNLATLLTAVQRAHALH